MDSEYKIESPALTGLSRAESALTHSGEYGGNPTATLFFDKRSVVVLPTKCNLYGFTGMQGNRSHGYGNLSQMRKFLRDHIPLHRMCRWGSASREEGETIPYSSMQLLF
jgi:hypothetical protein